MATAVVIVGGGVIGSSIAYFLASNPAFAGTVTVIERDPTYRFASSALSASSIRQQFSTPLNIELSRFGIGFLRRATDHLGLGDGEIDLGLKTNGYLILASAEGQATLEEVHAIQRANDVAVRLMSPGDLAERFPWLSVEGITGGSYGLADEGWFDGYGLLQAFRARARAHGVSYVADEATALKRAGSRITGVMLKSGGTLSGDIYINACGPWAGAMAATAGIDLPVRARRRMVHVFSCRADLPADMPLIADPSGVWLRPEGAQFIAGSTPFAGDPDPDDLPLEVDAGDFEEVIWPAVATRIPAFEAIKSTGAWAGYYEVNTVDHNGIVGPHRDVGNLLFANGFSGHGLQHAPGVGRGVAEFIMYDTYRSLDLSPLSFDRILEGRPYREINVI